MIRRALVLALLLAPSVVRAAPIEFVEQRKNFMIFNDVDGSIEHANWYNRDSFYAGYNAVEEGFLAVHPDDSQFLVAYSTFDLTAGVGAFYQSLSNDIAGIGYKQAAEIDAVIPSEFFDDTPNSQLTGFLHMNNWRNFLLEDQVTIDDEWISLVFGQELGHAWLAFAYANLGQDPSKIMLGRSEAHWNFYMHTDGSPVEGHRWLDKGNGDFEAVKLDKYQFSDLDLYLMGLMAPEEVQPWFVITDPHDCIDSSKENMECAPVDGFGFKADQYRVKGTRVDITIDDVIAAEGPRIPAYPDTPNEYGLSFILIKRPDEILCDEEIAVIDEVIQRSIDQWVAQTRDRANIINNTHTDEALPAACGEDTTSGGDDTTTSGDPGSTSDANNSTSADPTNTPTSGNAETSAVTEADTGDADSSGSATNGQQDDGSCSCNAPLSLTAAPWLLAPLLLRRRRR